MSKSPGHKLKSTSNPSTILIPASFTTHKASILEHLSRPESTYTDLSPKGSIDAPIRDLIDKINGLPGVVTTSSCSGRIAVFVQGARKDGEGHGLEDGRNPGGNPGGKGSGRWMYVTHEPLALDASSRIEIPDEVAPLLKEETEWSCRRLDASTDANSCPRLINLAFEPLILHICCASLTHAKPILALALDAGFRESGLQSLKCLEHAEAWPMVAIRSAGLAFSAVIGAVGDNGVERGIVGREVLRFLLEVANERFVENGRRVGRIRAALDRLLLAEQKRGVANGLGTVEWEDGDARARRKKAEGLKKRDEQRGTKEYHGDGKILNQDQDDVLGLGMALEAE